MSGMISELERTKMGGMTHACNFDSFKEHLPPGFPDLFYPTSNGKINYLACFKDQLKLDKSYASDYLAEVIKVTELLQQISNSRINLTQFDEYFLIIKK